MLYEMICAGFGGQGALTIGKFIVKAGMKEGKNVSWLPSYGPEMRGGTANVSVVVSDKPVASPIVSHPYILVALNQPSLDKFGPNVLKGGYLIANSDLCTDLKEFDGVKTIGAPFSTIAKEIGNPKVLNMVAIGLIIGLTNMVEFETLKSDLTAFLEKKNPALLELNIQAIQRGIELAKEYK